MTVSGRAPYSWVHGTNLAKRNLVSQQVCEAMQALELTAYSKRVNIANWTAYGYDGSSLADLGQTPGDNDLKTNAAFRHVNHIEDLRIALETVCVEYWDSVTDDYFTISSLLDRAVGRSNYNRDLIDLADLPYFDGEDLEEILKSIDLLNSVFIYLSAWGMEISYGPIQVGGDPEDPPQVGSPSGSPPPYDSSHQLSMSPDGPTESEITNTLVLSGGVDVGWQWAKSLSDFSLLQFTTLNDVPVSSVEVPDLPIEITADIEVSDTYGLADALDIYCDAGDATAATVEVAQGDSITLTIGGGSDAGIIILDFADPDYDTIAELVNEIVALSGWTTTMGDLPFPFLTNSNALVGIGATNALGVDNTVTLEALGPWNFLSSDLIFGFFDANHPSAQTYNLRAVIGPGGKGITIQRGAGIPLATDNIVEAVENDEDTTFSAWIG
jgi:hypothetical protein